LHVSGKRCDKVSCSGCSSGVTGGDCQSSGFTDDSNHSSGFTGGSSQSGFLHVSGKKCDKVSCSFHNGSKCGGPDGSGRFVRLYESRKDDFISSMIQIHELVKDSGEPNYIGLQIPVYSGINCDFLESELVDYNDRIIVDLMRYGAPIGHNAGAVEFVQSNHRNHAGARLFPVDIDKYISKELKYQSVLGPFGSNPFSNNLVLSPLNSCPKSDSEERRVIVDLSYPKGASVNDGIEKDRYMGEYFKLEYPKVDDLVELIRLKGKGCALFKCDLKRAYRQIPVCPGDYNLLGYAWKCFMYVDRVLPMGLRSAALICQRLTNAIAFIYNKWGWDVINYLDDFGGAEVWEKAEEAFDVLRNLLIACGLEESVAKACAPSTCMLFLGILLDTVRLTLSVTSERLTEILDLLKVWQNKTSATKKEVQSLVGKLNFVAKCVRPGRLFISRMLEFLRGYKDESSRVVSDEFLQDVKWWSKFVVQYNGVSMMPMSDWSNPDEILASDACLVGAGGWFNGKYFHCSFPEFIQSQSLHINALELLTVIVCFKLWGQYLKGQRIVIDCDNKVSVDVINSGRAKDKFLLKCLRELVWLAATFEFEIKARHIPGVTNRLPDLLSRWCLSSHAQQEFFRLTKGIQLSQCVIQDEIFRFSHDW